MSVGRAILLSLFFTTLLALWGCTKDAAPKTGRVDYVSNRNAAMVKEKGEEVMRSSCPIGMLLIPSGPALFGPVEERNVAEDKQPAQKMSMKAFCIDKFEYPNQPGEAPMRSVSWLEAGNLCKEKGKRLCSEYEFEKACRGPSSTLYAYGDGFASNVCPSSADDYGSGQFTNCVSGFGVQDMSGGVFEWTSSSGAAGSSGESSESRVLRGGYSKENSPQSGRCTYRVRHGVGNAGRDIGFRCCGAPSKEELSK